VVVNTLGLAFALALVGLVVGGLTTTGRLPMPFPEQFAAVVAAVAGGWLFAQVRQALLTRTHGPTGRARTVGVVLALGLLPWLNIAAPAAREGLFAGIAVAAAGVAAVAVGPFARSAGQVVLALLGWLLVWPLAGLLVGGDLVFAHLGDLAAGSTPRAHDVVSYVSGLAIIGAVAGCVGGLVEGLGLARLGSPRPSVTVRA
jgi:hypothetical protein